MNILIKKMNFILLLILSIMLIFQVILIQKNVSISYDVGFFIVNRVSVDDVHLFMFKLRRNLFNFKNAKYLLFRTLVIFLKKFK